MRIPKAAIPKFAGVKTDLLTDADNSDLRKAIRDAVPMAVEQTKDLAPYFKSTSERETCKRIFDFLKQRVKYRADDERQVVQMPSAILRPGAIADCKSLSLFTAAILQNLGIPWHFVLASYTDSAIPGHIYVETDGGCIVDVVWGKFDSEKKANHRYKMKVSYLAGITGPMMAGTKGSYKGCYGIGATEGAVEWAKRTGVWNTFNVFEKAKIEAAKIFGLAIIGRKVVLTMIGKNAGGLASMLKILRDESTKSQAGFDKMRGIEIKWLKNGGNPNELYEAIDKGASKTPTGKKFAEIMARKAKGESIGVKSTIQAAVSALFGKKYNPETGGISGEPTSDLAALLTSSAFWEPIVSGMAVAIGTAITAAILGKTSPSVDESTTGGTTTGGGTGGGAPSPTGGGTPSPTGGNRPPSKTIIPGVSDNTTYIIGGVAAVAAIWYFTKKKK